MSQSQHRLVTSVTDVCKQAAEHVNYEDKCLKSLYSLKICLLRTFQYFCAAATCLYSQLFVTLLHVQSI